MAAQWHFYDVVTHSVLNSTIDFDTDTIKLLLASNAYTPNQDTHVFRSSVTAFEFATAGGYTAGGVTLTSKVLVLDVGTNLTKFDADDVAWNPLTVTNARYAVMYKSRGGADTADELIGYVDFGSNLSPVAGNFMISWSINGIFTCQRI